MIFVIHGTGVHSWLNRHVLGSCRWWLPASLFCQGIREGLSAEAEIRTFQWSGDNSHRKRIEAGRALAALIEESRTGGPGRIALVGHSQGGNVALEAVNCLAGGMVHDVVLLASPHMAVQPAEGFPASIGGHLDRGKDGRCWLYWGQAPHKTGGRIWNLYSLQDAVQVLVASYLHGLRDLDRSTRFSLKVSREYRGSLEQMVHNAAIHWEADSWMKLLRSRHGGIKPHSAMHSQKMGRLIGRLLSGQDAITPALRSAGLREGPNPIEDLGCP